MEKTIKTGTTCISLKFKDGVIIAADNRATSYKIVGDNFTKIFNLTSNSIVTISGGVADAQRIIRAIKGELKLLELKNERNVYIKEIAMILSNYQYSLIKSGGIVGLILAGFDVKRGLSLYDLGVDGSILENRDYVTSGSGSVFVDGVLTTQYKKELNEKQAFELIEKCFVASFRNDNSSGGGYIVRIVTKDGVKEIANKKIKTEVINR